MEDLATLTSWSQESRLHICVDLASAPDGLRQITGSKQPVGARNLFEDAGTTDASAVAPWLLPVDTAGGSPWLPRSYQLACEAPAVTWIFGSLTTQTLVRRMVPRLDVEMTDGTPLILRYFDPRILSELHACLNADLAAKFFCLGSRWAYLNRDAVLQHIDCGTSGSADPLSEPVVLRPSEEQALVLASEAGQVLKETLKRWPDDLLKLSAQARFDLAKQACLHGERLGLTDLANKVLLLMLAAGDDASYFSSVKWTITEHALQSKKATLQQLLAANP